MRISKRVFQEKASQIFRKTRISYLLICIRTCAYQGVRNVHFSRNWEKNCPDAMHKNKQDRCLNEYDHIDSGCTKTVCEEASLKHYLQSLSFDEYKEIFKFGDNKIIKKH